MPRESDETPEEEAEELADKADEIAEDAAELAARLKKGCYFLGRRRLASP